MWCQQGCLQLAGACSLVQGCPGPGGEEEHWAWGLGLALAAPAAIWDSGKNSGPGWLELGAAVAEASGHFGGQATVCSEDKRNSESTSEQNRQEAPQKAVFDPLPILEPTSRNNCYGHGSWIWFI